MYISRHLFVTDQKRLFGTIFSAAIPFMFFSPSMGQSKQRISRSKFKYFYFFDKHQYEICSKHSEKISGIFTNVYISIKYFDFSVYFTSPCQCLCRQDTTEYRIVFYFAFVFGFTIRISILTLLK